MCHALFATDRFDPNSEPNLEEVLNQESILCSKIVLLLCDIKLNLSYNQELLDIRKEKKSYLLLNDLSEFDALTEVK